MRHRDGARMTEADQEAYGAILATAKVIRRAALRVFADEGLTDPQFQVLMLLVEKGPVLMRKLSDELFVTPANITGIVDRLEEKGLVTRTPGTGDRRATIIEISPAGKALFERVAIKKAEMLQKTLRMFTKDELVTLHGLLEKFQREMSQSVGGS